MNQQNNQNNYYRQEPQRYSGQYYQPPQFQNFYSANQQMASDFLRFEQKRREQKRDLRIVGVVIGCAIVAYLVIQLLVSSALQLFGLADLYSNSPLFQNCFNIIAVHICSLLLPFGVVAIILRKKFVSPVIPTAKVKPLTAFAWVGFGMAWCLGCNILVNIVVNIVEAMGFKLTQSEMLKPDSAFACVVLVFSTAIIPGIIEEFAMRCCTLGVLRRYGAGFGVFAVSVVFGLLHGNVIQFLYAFLVGILLAYITINTGSVVPAMFIHALANGLSVTNDVATYFSSEDTAENVLSVVIVFWLAAAVFGLVYLLLKKEFLPKKEVFVKAKEDVLSFGEKLVCLIPGFFVPFALLLILTVSTIHIA